MFSNQRQPRVRGWFSLGAVAVVLVGWLVGAAVMLQSYSAGAPRQLPDAAQCQRVCASSARGG